MSYSNYQNLRVLVVDDFKQFHGTICGMLESFGIKNVETVESANLALSYCKNRTYDIILCDYNMGQNKKNGQQILETLRHTNTLDTTLFVLVTAEVSKTMVMATYDNVPDAYIIKPFNAKLLQQRLDRLLERREAMMQINSAIDENEAENAIQLCEAQLREGGRYRSECMKLLGTLYQENGMVERAEQVYSNVLKTRPLDWAKVGLAQTKLLQLDFTSANTALNEVIRQNPMYMQAYDVLAECFMAQNQPELAQEVLKKATTACPRAILRQKSLALLAEENSDSLVAANAFQKTIDLGLNSCYDDLANHVGFARSAAELLAKGHPDGEDYIKKAQEVLEHAGKRFNVGDEENAQLHLIHAQVHKAMNNVAYAEKLLHSAEKIIKAAENPPSLDTSIDWIQTLNICGHEQQGESVLKQLVETHKENENALVKLDKLLDEPLSEAGRKRVAALNREGVTLHDDERYREAIEVFKRAQLIYPKYIGIRLNLAQSINAEVKSNGYDGALMTLCLNTLAIVESQITEEHPQHSRFTQLYDRARELVASP